MFGKAPKCFSHLLMAKLSHFIALIEEGNSKTKAKIHSEHRSKQQVNSAVRCQEWVLTQCHPLYPGFLQWRAFHSLFRAPDYFSKSIPPIKCICHLPVCLLKRVLQYLPWRWPIEPQYKYKTTFYCESCNVPSGVKVGGGIEEIHAALFCSFPR